MVKKRLRHKKYTDEYCEKWLLRVIKSLRFLFKVKIEIIDKDKIPNRTSVILLNHQSWFDIFVLPTILKDRPFSGVVKQELSKGLISSFFKIIDPIFVDRQNLQSKLKAIKEARVKVLDENLDLVIFPEGTRNKKDWKKLLPFYDGVSLISKSTMAPIIPVVIFNSHEVQKKYRFFLFKAPTIKAKVLKPIHPNTFLDKDLKIVTKNIQSKMQEELDSYNAKEKS